MTDDTCADEFEALEAALEELQSHDARAAEVVRLRFYAGLKVDEVAATLGVAARTVKLDFAFARAWLMRRVKNADASEN